MFITAWNSEEGSSREARSRTSRVTWTHTVCASFISFLTAIAFRAETNVFFVEIKAGEGSVKKMYFEN